MSRVDLDFDELVEVAVAGEDEQEKARLAEDVVGVRASDIASLSRITFEHIVLVRDCDAPTAEECEEMHSSKTYRHCGLLPRLNRISGTEGEAVPLGLAVETSFVVVEAAAGDDGSGSDSEDDSTSDGDSEDGPLLGVGEHLRPTIYERNNMVLDHTMFDDLAKTSVVRAWMDYSIRGTGVNALRREWGLDGEYVDGAELGDGADSAEPGDESAEVPLPTLMAVLCGDGAPINILN